MRDLPKVFCFSEDSETISSFSDLCRKKTVHVCLQKLCFRIMHTVPGYSCSVHGYFNSSFFSWYTLQLFIVFDHSCLSDWLPTFNLPEELKPAQSVISFLSVWCQLVTVISFQGPARLYPQEPIIWTHTLLIQVFKVIINSLWRWWWPKSSNHEKRQCVSSDSVFFIVLMSLLTIGTWYQGSTALFLLCRLLQMCKMALLISGIF